MVDGLAQDVRFGARMLAKSPGFTAVAALSLALGIGANTAIFTLINAVRLKMLPVAEPEQLVLLQWRGPEGVRTPASSTWGSNFRENGVNIGTSFSYPAYERIRDGNRVFSGIFGFANLGRVSITADGSASVAQAQMITGGAFEVLGARPALGRTLRAEDDQTEAPPVAVLSHGYWQRQFGGAPSAIGKSIDVNGKPTTIVGVAPAGFTGLSPGSADELWMPIRQLAVIQPERVRNGEGYRQNDFWWVVMMARLNPGTTREAAAANVDAIFKQQAMDGIVVKEKPPVIPTVALEKGGQGLDFLRRELDKPLSILMAVVFVVALIACANVANLLLSRAATRQREIAIRLSLGTNRSRLVRQLLTESALLATLGTMGGFVLAWVGSRVLLEMMGKTAGVDLSPDGRVLAFTAIAAIATTFLFGLAPALRATSIEPFSTLRETSTVGGSRKSLRLAKVLVVVQVALSLVLLGGASLFVRTLHNLRGVNAGFETDGLLLFGLNANQAGFTGRPQVELYERIQTSLDLLPGVCSSTITRLTFLSGGSSSYGLTIPGFVPKEGEIADARIMEVGNRFFETMKLPVVLGRGVDERDGDLAPRVAVANQVFVKKYLGSGNAIGRTFSFGRTTDKLVEIVGVAADARYDRLRGEILPTLYIPVKQNFQNLNGVFFEVRTDRDPLSIVPEVRAAVAAIHPGLPLFSVRSQNDQVDQLLRPERLFATLTTLFGVLALALVCVGLYGIISYGVAMRTTEIGVRMAVGAQARDIMAMVLRETASLVSAGVLLGVPIAFVAGYAATKFVESLLFGVTSTDLWSLLAATLVMGAVGCCAGALPARRASRVAPMTALRCE